MRTLAQLTCVVLLAILTNLGHAAANPPNILIITMDNVGYGDLPTYNPQSLIKTPRLDQLAAEGARLTSFYTASSTCTVSRACLLTGRVAQRHGLINQLPGVAGNYGVGLDQREKLIPHYLKSTSTPYATGCFGKWNIGFAPGSRPTERGFDEFIGHVSGNIDYYHHRYADRHDLFEGTEHLHREGTYSTDLFADAAIDFIQRKQQDDSPWFCYLPFNAPHFPMKKNKRPGQSNDWQAPNWALAAYGLSPDEKDQTKRFHATMTALDRAVGRVLDALDEAGGRESTFVFCMSDNGAFTQLKREGIDVGSNAPLHDGGITCWEGGIRVPAFARWPGQIEPGVVISETCWSPDLLVTSANLAAATLPDDIVFDGKDLLPLLADKAKSQHESLFFQFRTHSALRMGDWKIVREKPNQKWMLYNLSNDIGEQHELSAQHPERVEQLAAEFVRWLQDIEDSRKPPTFLESVQIQAAKLRQSDEPPASLPEWQQQRGEIRKRLLTAWGGFPKEDAPLEPRVLDTLDRDGYRVEKVIFQTFPDVWMTANAYVPDGSGKRPAVLCVHGHWRGAKQDPNVQARCIGLAKLGFFVLAVEAFGAGERAIGEALGEYHGEMVAATLLPIGRPLSGLQVYENQRAVDYLLTRPEVDEKRLGITGASGGGNQTMYAGAWDDRFKAVVPVCSVGNYQAYLGAACCMCEVVPWALQFTEEWGVLSLTAPRALMVINASQDARQFSIAEAQKSLAAVEPVYRLHERTDHLRHTTFESPHAYNQPMREAMYGWMTRHLKGEGDGSPITEPEMTLEEPETLRCYPGESRPDDWLTLPQFAAREGRQLFSDFPLPKTISDWDMLSNVLRARLERDVLGDTTPQVKIISAETSSPRKVDFCPEPNTLLTATVIDGEGPRRNDRVLIISSDGIENETVTEYVNAVRASGRTVVTLSLRATGEQAYEHDKIGQAPDHNTAEWSLWIGRPLLGQWVQDVKGALEATDPRTEPNGKVTVIGIGPAGVVALCAAAVTDRIDQIVTVGSLSSYISEAPYKNQRLGLMAPGIVRHVGDIPHLAAMIAPRRLILAGGVDGGGKNLNLEELTRSYAVTSQRYEILNRSERYAILATHSVADVVYQLE